MITLVVGILSSNSHAEMQSTLAMNAFQMRHCHSNYFPVEFISEMREVHIRTNSNMFQPNKNLAIVAYDDKKNILFTSPSQGKGKKPDFGQIFAISFVVNARAYNL